MLNKKVGFGPFSGVLQFLGHKLAYKNGFELAKIPVTCHSVKLSSSTDFEIKKYLTFILVIPGTSNVQNSSDISSSSLISLV